MPEISGVPADNDSRFRAPAQSLPDGFWLMMVRMGWRKDMHGSRIMTSRTLLWVALTAVMAALCVLSQRANAQDSAAKQKFVMALQNAVRADDKTWLADNMSFPVKYFGKQRTTIAGKAAFIAGYASFMSPKLKAVLAQVQRVRE